MRKAKLSIYRRHRATQGACPTAAAPRPPPSQALLAMHPTACRVRGRCHALERHWPGDRPLNAFSIGKRLSPAPYHTRSKRVVRLAGSG